MKNIRAYCVTLPETPESTEKARAHFIERGVIHEFFNGIHGEKFGLRTTHPYEVDHPGSGYLIGPKIIGIWLSHYFLWGALNLLHDEHFMILESDAHFPPDWEARLCQALVDVPRDFDMLYPGSCCCKGYPADRIQGDVHQIKPVPVGHGGAPQATHCYIVAKKALPVLLATQRKVYAPIDCSMIFHSFPQLKVYTVLPRIVDQFGHPGGLPE